MSRTGERAHPRGVSRGIRIPVFQQYSPQRVELQRRHVAAFLRDVPGRRRFCTEAEGRAFATDPELRLQVRRISNIDSVGDGKVSEAVEPWGSSFRGDAEVKVVAIHLELVEDVEGKFGGGRNFVLATLQ